MVLDAPLDESAPHNALLAGRLSFLWGRIKTNSRFSRTERIDVEDNANIHSSLDFAFPPRLRALRQRPVFPRHHLPPLDFSCLKLLLRNLIAGMT